MLGIKEFFSSIIIPINKVSDYYSLDEAEIANLKRKYLDTQDALKI